MAQPKYVIDGYVAPGYEPVRQQFEEHFKEGVEQCAQVCAYVEGIKVVDLWGALLTKSGRTKYNYGPHSIQNVFSSSKAVTSLVVAMLADRGYLKYDQKVSEIWPEYGVNGKENTTIAQVMRHEAGLSRFQGSLDAFDLSTESIKKGSVSDFIAKQKPSHVPGEKREYHSLTRGWIINEIVRRADPQGRTVGEFIRDEIAKPLGIENEIYLGIDREILPKVVPLTGRTLGWTYLQLLLPRLLGGGKVPLENLPIRLAILILGPFLGLFIRWGMLQQEPEIIRKQRIDPSDVVATEVGGSDPVMGLFNSAEVRRAEIPSANVHCTARALAMMAATIVEKGQLTGKPRLLTEKGVDEALANPVKKRMFFGLLDTYFTNAGWNEFHNFRFGYTGWLGLGGSVLQWQKEYRIGFGYAMNSLEQIRTDNWRGRNLQRIVLKCAKTLSKTPSSSL